LFWLALLLPLLLALLPSAFTAEADRFLGENGSGRIPVPLNFWKFVRDCYKDFNGGKRNLPDSSFVTIQDRLK